MSYVLVQPQAMGTAAAEVAGIGSAIEEATAAAAGETTGVLAAADDEVSAATATLFNAHARDWQAVLRRAASFHSGFVEALASAGNAYAETEAASVSTLATAADKPPFTFPTNYATVFISGSGIPVPSAPYMTAVFSNFVLPNFPNGSLANALALWTPAGLYPLTGTKVLTFNQSLAQGVQILDSTLLGTGVGEHGLIQPGGNPVVVQGISQGAMIASLEMEKLAALGQPADIGSTGLRAAG